VNLVRKLKDPRAVLPLSDALAFETVEDWSYGVAAALEELGDAQAVPALADAALDVRRPVARRREAAEALAAFQDPRAIEAMSRLAKEPEIGLAAAYGLFRLTGDEGALGKLREALKGADTAEALRLLRKCDDPRVEGVLVAGLDEAAPAVRPMILALLRERFPEQSRERVRSYVLKEGKSKSCSEQTIELLGELGDEESAECLLAILEGAEGTRWAHAARALAKTGDPRAVRYFSKARIVETDPGRRRLAEELYEAASARRAELDRAKRKG
jgi:HEAT repeat protein